MSSLHCDYSGLSVFFFFKQKTAYEMRISDWSSDVCSSDLQGAWESSARGLGPRDLAMHVALPEVDGRLFTRAVAFKAAARFDERTQCGIVVPQVLQDRVSFVSQLAANWSKLRRTPRSEEHTSELQSLMRNSYAVFCLKK